MVVEFLEKFYKDLNKLKQPSIKVSVINIIALAESAKSVFDIPNVKKLKGHITAYRIRIGDYRIGVFVEKGTIEFARIVHRKDIYDVFP